MDIAVADDEKAVRAAVLSLNAMDGWVLDILNWLLGKGVFQGRGLYA